MVTLDVNSGSNCDILPSGLWKSACSLLQRPTSDNGLRNAGLRLSNGSLIDARTPCLFRTVYAASAFAGNNSRLDSPGIGTKPKCA